MGILSKITLGVFGQKQVEKRDATPQLVSDPNFSIFGTGTPDATTLSTASAAIWLIASSYASADCQLFTTKSGSPKPANHPLAEIMLNGTDSQSAFLLKLQLMSDLLTHGEAFAHVEFDANGRISNLNPLPFNNVSVDFLGNNRILYRYSDPLNNYVQTVYTASQVAHIMHRPKNGRGRSALSLSALSAGIAVDTENATAANAQRGFKAGGVLSAPGAISDETAERLKQQLQTDYSGPEAAGRILVAGDGLELKSFAVSNRDAELADNRKLNSVTIAQAFGVPAESVGVNHDASWGSSQQASIQLVQNALNPWSESLNQQLAAFCLSPRERKSMYLRSSYDHLVRGTFQDLAASVSSLISSGAWTINEARSITFDLPAVDGGETVRIPLNTAAITAGNQPTAGGGG
ncbi:phage portal protein [Agrobacterium rhizogenes]|nr:phage portal protein [Rhizobium rhizogenes]